MNDRRSALRAVAVACGAVLAAAPAAAPAAALDPQQFVAGWPVELPAEADVFDLPLTAEVYAYAENVEQLAVLDANGAPLSFFLRSAAPAAVTQQRLTLQASPLYAENGAAAVATVGVTTRGNGTAVTVTEAQASSPDVVGFVIDARTVATAPSALELDWRPLPQPFLLDVRVEQSSNLTDWRNVGGASVAALVIGTAEVRHARVPVAASPGGYYRIRVNRTVADWYLLGATLVSAETEALTLLEARAVPLAAADLPADRPPQALYFDAGGAVPASAVSFDFGAAAGWVRADVAASNSLAGPWSSVVYGELFYALDYSGQRFASPPQAMSRIPARYWRVLPAAPAAAPFELTLHYGQETLRVAARGTAPYLLAAGTLDSAAGPDATFAAVWTEVRPGTAAVSQAGLGARRELGGPAALVAPTPFPWRKVALWAALCAGVLVVGFMAVRLAREMQTQSS